MGLKKGHTNNPDGRPKGAKSKRTIEWEELGEAIITKHSKRFNEILAEADDEQFAKHYKDILNYFKPKINHNTNDNHNTHEPIQIEIIERKNK